MSSPETALIPREAEPGSAVFSVPWHAEALGIANALMRTGMYTAVEWGEALGAEIRCLEADGAASDTEETYYRAVLAALERLVGDKTPEAASSLVERTEAWRRAYLNTPHGQPVTLAAAFAAQDDHNHDQSHHHHS